MKWIFAALRTQFRGHVRTARVTRLVCESLEERSTPASTDFRSVIGLDAVQNLYPYQGTGYTVAILDTGIDYNDTDLGGGFGAGKRVVAGYDFVNNDADPMDDHGHGTHLAGIIGSSNPALIGIAPNVNFVALKVLDSKMNGTWANVDKALQWVIANQSKYNIVAVNLSLGSGAYASNPFTLLENDFSALKNMGVFTSVASGNAFYTNNSAQGISFPAVSTNVVSVGATWAGDFGSSTFSNGATDYTTAPDRIAAFTQRSSALSLMAPGAWITSDGLRGNTLVMGGTSQATAVVTGSAVLLHQAYDQTGKAAQATQDNILAVMKSTGVTVIDGDDENDNVTNTGLAFKRINLQAAVAAIGKPIALPTLAAVPDQTLTVGGTINVNLVATSPQGAPITFTVKQIYLPAQAYTLDQQYGLNSNGNYYTNLQGQNEKWILGTGNVWFTLMPNGDLRRWAGNMATTLTAANLVGTLDASYYADPTKLWNAPYAGMPPVVFGISGSKLSIRAPAYWVGTYQVEVTASDGQRSVKQVFNVNEVAPVNAAPVLAAIANQTITRAQTPLVVTLAGSDTNNDPLTYSAQVLPTNGQTPAVTATVKGNQLTLTPAASLVGTFTVQASVSDGKASDVKTFTVTVTNAGPTLDVIAAQTINAGQTSVNVTMSASDPDKDALTFQASVQTPSATLYQLQQTYGFLPASATYYLNLRGKDEKWLVDRKNTWYALLPTGQLYRWSVSMTQTMTAANLIAALDPSVYTEPRLLWDAKPATTPALTLTWQGNVLTIGRPAGLTGVFYIDVTVSDGVATAKRTFQMTLS